MTFVSTTDRYLSPQECARRLGVSVKALRLYERHGLVMPLRSDAGWRAYGPEQMARLHQVLALKRLGLPLARIAELLSGRLTGLSDVLAVQEQALTQESARVTGALTLIRAARARLAHGGTLSIDDLTQLTKETTMTSKPTDEIMKQIFDPLSAKHFTPEEMRAFSAKAENYDQAAVTAAWDGLIAEAKALLAKGDPASREAMDLARRWKAQVDLFTGGDAGVETKVRAIWSDAMADPKAAPMLPLNPELFAFVGKAAAAAKAKGVM